LGENYPLSRKLVTHRPHQAGDKADRKALIL